MTKFATAAKADEDATKTKAAADAAHQLKDYKNETFYDLEGAYAKAVNDKETKLDDKFKAYDDLVEKTHILNR